jgi:hypothetical protein
MALFELNFKFFEVGSIERHLTPEFVHLVLLKIGLRLDWLSFSWKVFFVICGAISTFRAI